jgi:NTE family protein
MFKPPHVFCAIALLFASALAEERAVTLYLGGDYSFVEYHLGVLSELERLQIPIDTVVGTEWGAFTGALWSAGLSSGQIRELIKSHDSLPRARQPQNSALWKRIWLVKHDENGVLSLEEADSKPYFGHLLFDFRIQEILLNSNIGSKIHFREIDSSNNYPFPPAESDSATIRIFSNPIALRDTNGTPAQRHQIALWSRDTALIMLRPHSKPNMDSLFETGVAVVQSRRSVLAQINPQLRHGEQMAPQQQTPQQPRFYHPVFDSTPAELHGHLKSFWDPNAPGIAAVGNFLENLQRDASYRDLKLTADSVFLQIKTDNTPQLSLSFFGFGGTLFGANIAASADFRFVNQFGYGLDLAAFYGQGVRGFEGGLRLERLFLSDGTVFTKVKILESEPLPFFQKNIDEKARLLSENSRSIILRFEKPTGYKAALQIAAEFERKEIVSGAAKYPIIDGYDDEDEEIVTGFFHKPVVVNSMFPYMKWLWQSEGYNRWFASDGFMAEFLGGFKAVSVIDINQNTAPYFSSQGKVSITQPILKYVSISGGAELGANFRTSKGKLALPEELEGVNDHYDPALDNRYKFAMGMGSYMEEWQTPANSSHRYGIASAGFSLQWQGSGVFLTGGYGTEKFFAEPKIRIKSRTFDIVLGQSIAHSAKKRVFLSVQGGDF